MNILSLFSYLVKKTKRKKKKDGRKEKRIVRRSREDKGRKKKTYSDGEYLPASVTGQNF